MTTCLVYVVVWCGDAVWHGGRYFARQTTQEKCFDVEDLCSALIQAEPEPQLEPGPEPNAGRA